MSVQTGKGGVKRVSSRVPAEPRSGGWSDEEINTLMDLWGQGLSNADIAARLGRHPGAISVKANRLGLGRKTSAETEPDGPQTKVRNCLGCQRSFKSAHFGNRYCETCKSSDNWRSGGSHSFIR